jgi:hypothetical protein
MTIRNRLLALLAASALSVMTVAQADNPNKIVSIDYGIETSSDTILMPSSGLGTVVLTCTGCTARSYQLTNQTAYFIGEKQATFATFGAYLKTSGVRSAVLFVKPDGKAVTRIRVSIR